MPTHPLLRRELWLVPVVLAICAVMVLPGGAIFHVSASPSNSLSPATSATSPASPAAAAPPAASGLLSPSARALSSPSSLATLSSPHNSATWLDSLLNRGSAGATQPLASYPNLYLLEHPATNVAQTIYPSYQAQPAPMGIADYGLGATPYTYSPSHFLGSLTLLAPPNVTDPGSQGVIDPGEATLGAVGSYYEWGLQLNTVLTNVSLPGTNDGIFWTQNVLNINDTGIHFVQDIFNFTSTSFYIPTTGTILSGCGMTDLTPMLTTYGGVYQCVGGTIPISPANYPLTIDLYNNVTITSGKETKLVFGAQITGHGVSLTSGAIDTVIFNNPNASVAAPPFPPGFTVSGTSITPVGLLYDSELDLVGDIGGDNAVFRSLDGSLTLGYSNATSGPFASVPSAYNFGGDTGETSTGIASTWSGTTESITQGPSLLYGLWGAVPWISVPSGSIQFSGSVTPNYGFVFLSNVDPSTVANLTGTNMSWVPTNASGGFTTSLPPSVPPSAQYYVQAFAPGEGVYTGAPFSTSQTSYTISMTSAPGTLNAPIYMRNNLQANALAAAVGSTSPVDTFSNLVVNLNYTFNHLNDYGFPSFSIFSAEQVTVPLAVNDLSQGFDSPMGNFYYYDSPAGAPTGYFAPGAAIIPLSLENYSDQIQVLGSTAVTITNETLVGTTFASYGSAQGGSIILWKDSGAVVKDVTVTFGFDYVFAGVFVGDSLGTVVQSVTVSGESNGVVDVGSTGTAISWVNASGAYTFGIYALSSSGGSYSDITAVGGAYGVYAGGYTGYDYYAIPGITNTAVTHVVANLNESTGIAMFYSASVTATDVSAWGDAVGELSVFSEFMILTGLTTNSIVAGAIFEYSAFDTISQVTVSGAGTGAILILEYEDTGLDATSPGILSPTFVVEFSEDVSLMNVEYAIVSGDFAYGPGDVGTALLDVSYSVVLNSSAGDGGIAVVVQSSAVGTIISGVVADGGSLGVFLLDVFQGIGFAPTSISQVAATNGSLGVYVVDSVPFILPGFSTAVVDQVSATNMSTGVYVAFSYGVSITNVTATNQSLGASLGLISIPTACYPAAGCLPPAAVATYESSDVFMSNVVATNYPVAVLDQGSGTLYSPSSEGIYVSGVTATNVIFAALLEGTANSTFSGIDSTGAYEGVFALGGAFFGLGGVNNTFTGGSYVGSVSFGIYLIGQTHDLVWDNSFIDNNGATSTYNPGTIQAYDFQGTGDQWDLCGASGSCTGNYWSDWHTYLPSGQLAPYLIGGTPVNYDYYPIGLPAGESAVTFQATGLPAGTAWSVTFNGMTQSSTGSEITFGAMPGTYAFSVAVPSGYSASPSGGNLTVTASGPTSAMIAFAAVYTVTLTEFGLPAGTTWTAIFGGVSQSSSSASMTFSVPSGTYEYQVGSASGFSASPSGGTVSVTGNYAIAVTYSALTYAVTLTAGGLGSGTTWSATVNGVTQSTTGPALVFYLADGTYNYSFNAVSGYNVGANASGTVTVAGASVSLSNGYSAKSTTSVASSSDLTNDFAVALAIGLIALVIAIVALILKRGGRPGAPTPPPEAWKPPAGTAGTESSPGWKESESPGSEGPKGN